MTSFDWNHSNTNKVVTSSINKKCVMWDIEVRNPHACACVLHWWTHSRKARCICVCSMVKWKARFKSMTVRYMMLHTELRLCLSLVLQMVRQGLSIPGLFPSPSVLHHIRKMISTCRFSFYVSSIQDVKVEELQYLSMHNNTHGCC